MVYVSLTIISKQTAILTRTISSKCRNFENRYNSLELLILNRFQVPKMCEVVIPQCEGYTQHKPGVVDYYEPFRDVLHQILKVYAP